ncbi:hypothetical protein C7212DRAFT_366513 [Tuber magnatum]|uniref:Uncharacterized protein n=1 Tax=Tuber magnatum TaxID=42249 RepID=A0A317SI34_9PEZI|nr:hypothetical protein C7212DRAFT_366513 [Tuber magnatum]
MSEVATTNICQSLHAQVLAAEAAETLRKLANLLCKIHEHEIAPLDPDLNNKFIGYSLIIKCGEVGIAWKVEIWRNGNLKRISHCTKSFQSIKPGSNKYRITLIPINTWEMNQCYDILELHRSGQLKEDWWNYPIVINEEDADTINYYNDFSTNYNPENKNRGIEAGYGKSGSGNVVYHPYPYCVNTILEASGCYPDSESVEHETDSRSENEDSSSNWSEDCDLEDEDESISSDEKY